ncbi:hypothetical protein EJB05_06430 [Eragrostis curvula]|uniref:Uncharacterized protein n=1 Tax=Eragrostis curvula TaxID=38414 RepID=A0A5J9WF75_9POAL|nr:hypothetical protein EJB05_06430 [Eragrostis curvula]
MVRPPSPWPGSAPYITPWDDGRRMREGWSDRCAGLVEGGGGEREGAGGTGWPLGRCAGLTVASGDRGSRMEEELGRPEEEERAISSKEREMVILAERQPFRGHFSEAHDSKSSELDSWADRQSTIASYESCQLQGKANPVDEGMEQMQLCKAIAIPDKMPICCVPYA